MPTDKHVSPEGWMVVTESPKARTVPLLKGVQCGRCERQFTFGKGIEWNHVGRDCIVCHCPIAQWRLDNAQHGPDT